MINQIYIVLLTIIVLQYYNTVSSFILLYFIYTFLHTLTSPASFELYCVKDVMVSAAFKLLS